jgi:ClpP class serine protease
MIDVLFAMEETALQSFVDFKSNLDKQRALATPDQIDKVTAAVQKIQSSTGQFFSFDEESGDAIIPITGTLTPKPEICVSLHDGSQTLYPSIIDSIAQAEKMRGVKRIKYIFATPGGYVSGIEPAAIAMKNAKIPSIGIITDMAASAGYWLASQCGELVAQSPLSSAGSIGVLVEVVDRSKQYEDHGIKRYVLTSKNAPEKFPDVGTKAGRDKVITRLTDIEKVFISRVAEGRGVSIEKVKEDFGRGAVFTAEDALMAGMIDRIENTFSKKINKKKVEKIESPIILNADTKQNLPSANTVENKPKQKENTMNELEKFLAENSGAKADYDKAIVAAGKAGEEKINARIESAKNFIANKDYPTLGEMALQVITGKIDQVSLTASVAAIDALIEKKESDAVVAEGEELAETPGEEVKPKEESNVCESEEELKAIIKARKGE